MRGTRAGIFAVSPDEGGASIFDLKECLSHMRKLATLVDREAVPGKEPEFKVPLDAAGAAERTRVRVDRADPPSRSSTPVALWAARRGGQEQAHRLLALVDQRL